MKSSTNYSCCSTQVLFIYNNGIKINSSQSSQIIGGGYQTALDPNSEFCGCLPI